MFKFFTVLTAKSKNFVKDIFIVILQGSSSENQMALAVLYTEIIQPWITIPTNSPAPLYTQWKIATNLS